MVSQTAITGPYFPISINTRRKKERKLVRFNFRLAQSINLHFKTRLETVYERKGTSLNRECVMSIPYISQLPGQLLLKVLCLYPDGHLPLSPTAQFGHRRLLMHRILPQLTGRPTSGARRQLGQSV